MPWILAGAWLAAAPALAGRMQTGDSKESKPAPKEGSEVEVSFNPTVTITVRPGETIESLLQRLADGINEAGAGGYFATVEDTAPALDIRRSDGTEIDQLRLRENDPVIQSTEISVNLPGLVARIGAVTETPSTGTIFVTVNGRVASVASGGLTTPAELNQAVADALVAVGFEVELTPTALVVWRDLLLDRSITSVGWRSTDQNIRESDISLEATASIPALGPGGIVLLLALIALAGWRAAQR
jgi:hypothetical protein